MSVGGVLVCACMCQACVCVRVCVYMCLAFSVRKDSRADHIGLMFDIPLFDHIRDPWLVIQAILHVLKCCHDVCAAPPPDVSYSGAVPLDCSGLLVGDSCAVQRWPGSRGPLPGGLGDLLESMEASLQVGWL